MTTQDSVMLRCDGCGHEWRSRNTEGKARQCSKCRSRRMSEVHPDELVLDSTTSNPMAVRSMTMRGRSTNASSPYYDAFADDPDARKKRKELEIAKLDRQIAEEKGLGLQSDTVMRFVGRHKMLLSMLHDGGFLDDDEFEFLSGECPWCGGGFMEHVEVRNGIWGWKCHNCGKEAI